MNDICISRHTNLSARAGAKQQLDFLAFDLEDIGLEVGKP
jgi:hypothetical protein